MVEHPQTAGEEIANAVTHRAAKAALRVLDHSAIHLPIAGTYTPFVLGPLRGPWGWSLLGTVWGLALVGIASKLTIGFRFSRRSTALSVAMGWLVLVATHPLVARASPATLLRLVAGGICYTGGVGSLPTDSPLRDGHAVCHLFVAGGSACHVVAVLGQAAAPLG